MLGWALHSERPGGRTSSSLCLSLALPLCLSLSLSPSLSLSLSPSQKLTSGRSHNCLSNPCSEWVQVPCFPWNTLPTSHLRVDDFFVFNNQPLYCVFIFLYKERYIRGHPLKYINTYLCISGWCSRKNFSLLRPAVQFSSLCHWHGSFVWYGCTLCISRALSPLLIKVKARQIKQVDMDVLEVLWAFFERQILTGVV